MIELLRDIAGVELPESIVKMSEGRPNGAATGANGAETGGGRG
ncbi:MAG: hypothetical protein U0992_08135 [Planctomycetaceae bacterium]